MYATIICFSLVLATLCGNFAYELSKRVNNRAKLTPFVVTILIGVAFVSKGVVSGSNNLLLDAALGFGLYVMFVFVYGLCVTAAENDPDR